MIKLGLKVHRHKNGFQDRCKSDFSAVSLCIKHVLQVWRMPSAFNLHLYETATGRELNCEPITQQWPDYLTGFNMYLLDASLG